MDMALVSSEVGTGKFIGLQSSRGARQRADGWHAWARGIRSPLRTIRTVTYAACSAAAAARDSVTFVAAGAASVAALGADNLDTVLAAAAGKAVREAAGAGAVAASTVGGPPSPAGDGATGGVEAGSPFKSA
jgi:hypothetical protein